MTRATLAELLEATSPATRAREAAAETIAVVSQLAPLLPHGGLARGTATQVDDAGLLLALAAAPANATTTTWTGVIGIGDLGLAAAMSAGLPWQRMLLADDVPDEHYAEIVSTLAGVCSIILTRPPAAMADRTATRLTAHLRRHNAILLAYGNPWPGAAMRLGVSDIRWSGLGTGWGQLAERRCTVHAVGRGAAARPRALELLLPDSRGRVSDIVDEPAPETVLTAGTGPVARAAAL